jgi:HAD superfamily hydrolase (TIGR01484 family)
MKKYIFFDLDNTLTRSRSPITPSMTKLLLALSKKHEVFVVSGADAKQIATQIGPKLAGKYWSMGQNGNACITPKGEVLWENKMNWLEKHEVLAYSYKLFSAKLYPHKDKLDLLQDRGCQLSYSFIGHHEDVSKKEKFDPDHKKRQSVLKKFPFKSKTVDVKIAGTTCFDFFIKGKNKGSNINALLKQMKWKKGECLYVGDALFKNGNDESVIGVIPTQAVRDPSDTEEVIKKLLN